MKRFLLFPILLTTFFANATAKLNTASMLFDNVEETEESIATLKATNDTADICVQIGELIAYERSALVLNDRSINARSEENGNKVNLIDQKKLHLSIAMQNILMDLRFACKGEVNKAKIQSSLVDLFRGHLQLLKFMDSDEIVTIRRRIRESTSLSDAEKELIMTPIKNTKDIDKERKSGGFDLSSVQGTHDDGIPEGALVDSDKISKVPKGHTI